MCLVYGHCASLLLAVGATLATTVILQEGGLTEIGFRDQDMAAVEPTQEGARWQGMRLKKGTRSNKRQASAAGDPEYCWADDALAEGLREGAVLENNSLTLGRTGAEVTARLLLSTSRWKPSSHARC